MQSKKDKQPRSAKIRIPNPQAEMDLAEVGVYRWDNLKGSIRYLQGALRAKFGNKIDTSSGAGTIYLSHDRAEISNKNGDLIAETPIEVAARLY